MGKKDYYIILGVSRTETEGGIRAAFRELAKKHHPDISGAGNTRQFQDITEAYGVLSDSEKREAYNRSLTASERRRTAPRETRLSAVYASGRLKRTPPFSAFFSYGRARSSFDDLFSALPGRSNRVPPGATRSRRTLDLEVILSPAEAEQGGILPIRIPVLSPCPFCMGSGHRWPFTCMNCYGEGSVGNEETVRVAIPAGVEDRAVSEVAIRDADGENILLRLRFFVQG